MISNLPISKIKCCNVRGLTNTIIEKINLFILLSLLKFIKKILKKTMDKKIKKSKDKLKIMSASKFSKLNLKISPTNALLRNSCS